MSHSIAISRSPDEVFAYVTDPSKLGTWQDAEDIAQLTPGAVGSGTRFREVHKALGRRRVEVTEVMVFEPGRRFDIRVVEGTPVEGRWDFEATDAGTLLTMTPTVRLPRGWRHAEPLVAFATTLVFARFHRRLKRVLEGA